MSKENEIDWKETLLKVHTDYVKNQSENNKVTSSKNLKRNKKGPAAKGKIKERK